MAVFEVLGGIVFAFFLILGITECYRMVVGRILQPDRKGHVTMRLYFEGHNEEAEFILRSAIERLRWLGGAEEKELLCIDGGMDAETRMVCELLARKYSFLHIRREGGQEAGE